MNLLLLETSDFISAEKVCIAGRRMEHVRAVCRASPGDSFRIGVLNGRCGSGKVITLNDRELEMEVVLDSDPPPLIPATLLLALPRPKSLRKAIEAASSLGIKRIFIMESWRVEKSYWTSPVLDPLSLREHAILGLEQARDTVLPDIQIRKRFKPFLEDEVGTLVKGTRPLLAHPYDAQACPHAINEPVTLAIGPEGGFIPYEVEMFRMQGFTPVTLGERILRVEFAIPALIGRLFG